MNKAQLIELIQNKLGADTTKKLSLIHIYHVGACGRPVGSTGLDQEHPALLPSFPLQAFHRPMRLCGTKSPSAPVSYTHLDVYKRQVQDAIPSGVLPDIYSGNPAVLAGRYIGTEPFLIKGTCLDPVSYTHLEVYKRQPRNRCAANSCSGAIFI